MSSFDLMAAGVPIAIAIRLATIAATLVLARRVSACRVAALAGSAAASVLTAAAAIDVLVTGRSVGGVLVRHAASGFVLGWAVAPLAAWFLMVLGVVAVPVAVYSAGYFAHAVPASARAPADPPSIAPRMPAQTAARSAPAMSAARLPGSPR